MKSEVLLPPTIPRLENSPRKAERLPDVSQLHLDEKVSLQRPQPRKALVSPRILLAAPSNQNLFDSTFDRAFQESPAIVDQEALSELMEIIRSSSQSGWLGTESPFSTRSPRGDDDFTLITREDDMMLEEEEEEEEEGEEGEEREALGMGKGMGMVPTLSHSPASLSLSRVGFPLQRARSAEPFRSNEQLANFNFGTPPSRAPNPLAFSCHFASMEEGAELDLFRPSPPIYDRREAFHLSSWN